MSKLHWWLLIAYLAVAAGYGGWRGPDLWAGWGVWLLVLPAVAWGAVSAQQGFRSGVPLNVVAAMTAFGVVGLGAGALGIAWGVAEAAGRWSTEPAVRAV